MRAAWLAVTVALGVISLIALTTGMAAAQSPPAEPAPAVLEGRPPAEQATGRESVTLSATLRGEDGTPARGEAVDFYILTTVFGERLMKVGQARTDATGTASLLYEPSWDGEHTVVARYAGGDAYAPTQTAFRFSATGSTHLHENSRFGLEAIRKRAPLGAALTVLAVWGVLGLVLLRTVRGIPAAALAAGPAPLRAAAPMPRLAPARLRPAPLRPVLAVITALVLLAVPVGWFQSRGRVELRASPSDMLDDGAHQAGSGRALPARLLQFVPAIATDAGGLPTPDSADLPADVALVHDRVFVLDTNKGRIMTVTRDGKLARIFESDPGGETSILGASAMTAHDGDLYAAGPLFGNMIVVSPAGKVEQVVRIEVPAGEHPFQPAGIAVTDEGQIWLSDSNNHRVVSVNPEGHFRWSIGEGAVSSGEYGLDTPGGLAVDALGNLWVADSGNHVIKKYSPMGVFLTTVGQGVLGRPKAVATDDHGTIFVSDDELSAVLAFAPDGTLLGSLKTGNPDRPGGPPPLQAPNGIKVDGDTVYVMDRLSGLFVFNIVSRDAH